MLRLDKTTCLSLHFKLILLVRLWNNLWGSNVLLFLELTNMVSILYCNFIEFVILLYTFLEISFSRYKEYIIWLISLVSCHFIFRCITYLYLCKCYWQSVIDNLWNIFLGVNILSHVVKGEGRPSPWIVLYLALDAILE